jgi:hypothetical protein
VGTLAAPGDEELLDERLDVEELDVALLILDHDALDIDVSLFVVELVSLFSVVFVSLFVVELVSLFSVELVSLFVVELVSLAAVELDASVELTPEEFDELFVELADEAFADEALEELLAPDTGLVCASHTGNLILSKGGMLLPSGIFTGSSWYSIKRPLATLHLYIRAGASALMTTKKWNPTPAASRGDSR